MTTAEDVRINIQPTPLSQPFWDACRARKLIVPRCEQCTRHFFRPEIACPHCFSREWRWVESSGRGTLYSFTVVHRAPSPAFAVPFVLAAVDVDEGWSMFSNVIGCAPEAVRIGMRLQVAFDEVAPGLVLPKFRPAESTGPVAR